MKFITVRDLRERTAALRRDIAKEREIVVTANGRPFAILTQVGPDTVEEEVAAIRRARARAAVDRIRARAARRGRDRGGASVVEAVVSAARKERKGRE